MTVGTLSAPLLALFCLLPGTVLELAAFAALVLVVQTIAAVSPLALSLRGVPRPAPA